MKAPYHVQGNGVLQRSTWLRFWSNLLALDTQRNQPKLSSLRSDLSPPLPLADPMQTQDQARFVCQGETIDFFLPLQKPERGSFLFTTVRSYFLGYSVYCSGSHANSRKIFSPPPPPPQPAAAQSRALILRKSLKWAHHDSMTYGIDTCIHANINK